MKIDDLLEKFKGVTPNGAGRWKVLCPCHADKQPSLAIAIGENARIVLHCHGGCTTETILQSIHLDFNDLFDSGRSTTAGRKAVAGLSESEVNKRHVVYSCFLGYQSLSVEHEKNLLGRGLTPSKCLDAGYRSLSLEACKSFNKDRRREFDLLTIPGFHTDASGNLRPIRTDGLVIPVRDIQGRIQALQIRTEDTDGKYKWFSTAEQSCGSPCHWPLACAGVHKERIRLVEGPLKADVVMALDPSTPTIGFPGVSTWESAIGELERLSVSMVSKPTILLAFDSDWQSKPTVKYALHGCYKRLRQLDYPVEIEWWPEFKAKGLDDLLLKGMRPELLGDAEESTKPSLEEEFPEHSNLLVVGLEDIHEGPIQWLWPGWLPFGTFCTLDGDPGEGKSTLVSALAVHLSLGHSVLPGSTPVHPRRTLIMACEDPREQTWKPRLIAAGIQDQTMIRFWDGRLDEKKRRWLPSIPEDIRGLEYLIRSQDAGLVVIDPLFSFIDSKYDSFKSQHMQQVLNELADLAARTGTCILGIRHFNKAVGLSALYRGSGSISIVGVARSGLAIVRDDEDESIRYLAQSKTNFGELQQPIKFHIENQKDYPSRSYIVWDGTETRSLRELTKKREETEKPSQKATILLVNLLQENAVKAASIYDAAKRAGVSEITLRRAKQNLGIQAYQEEKHWYWRFPNGESK